MAGVEAAEANQALAALVQGLPAMVYRRRHDDDQTICFVSEGCRALTGYSPTELQANHLMRYGALIHPEDKPALLEEIDAALAARAPYLCAYRLLAADGQERWVLDQGRAMLAPETTEEILLEGVIIDNTARVIAFRQLQQGWVERTRKLAALYEIFSAAAATDDLETALARVLRRTLLAAHGQAAFLHLAEEAGERATLVAHEGLPAVAASEMASLSAEHPLLVAAMDRPGYRLLTSPYDGAAAWLPGCCRDADAYLATTVVANGRTLGVLSLLSGDRARQTTEEIELLLSVAAQIGALVETARLRQQAEHLAVLEERNRLARELHDAVTQALYSVILFAEAGRRLAEAGDAVQAAAHFSNVTNIGQQALGEMRLLLHRLRPSVLAAEGLVAALAQRLNGVEARVGVRHQLLVEGEIAPTTAVEEAVYHICQEALNNALRHGRATEVRVKLRGGPGGALALSVEDNGSGFVVETALAGAGLGLKTMRERAALLGGQVTYDSAPGAGTTVSATFAAAAAATTRAVAAEDVTRE